MRDRMHKVDELVSFAHRVGEDVAVQLQLPAASLPPGTAEVRLRSGKRSFVVPAEVSSEGAGEAGGARVTFTAPGSKVERGVWRLALQPSSEEGFARVQARLLVRPSQPVALLPGPVPATRMPAPEPRRPQSAAVRLAHQLPTPVQDALRRGRSALHR